MNSKHHFSIITQSLFLITTVLGVGCIDNLFIIDEVPNNWDAGKIVMHQTGGIAGISRIITIEEKEGMILLTSVSGQTNQRLESPVSPKELDKLWQTLEANDIFTLPTNQEMLATVMDGFGYDITVQRGEKQHQFSVYAPGQLVENGETRYNDIVQAMEQFANSRFQDAEEFIIADMPINDISVELLESFPLQVHIVVNGFLRDGCTTLNEITQRRDGNTISVHITTKRPKDAVCIQIIKEVQERIPLEGSFLPGRYKVTVNNIEKEFEI
ncbi:hypothetical protein FJZ31_12655 [Candidatus Poribacteria bacterium]|nr:hypothetical protein [Candidatus Poribacteria bacterium]